MCDRRRSAFPSEPQENLLYFIEKHAPLLEPWQREVVRIVRKIGQYFYPQRQTQVMNEGWATFWHYTMLNGLYDKGLVSDGFMMEVLQTHTNVVFQPPRRTLLQRHQSLCPRLRHDDATSVASVKNRPPKTAWFPDIAGSDWLKALEFAMRNFKDESFIAQYLSPKLIRDFHLFAGPRRRSRRHAGDHLDPRRTRATATCVSSWPSNTTSATANPTSRSGRQYPRRSRADPAPHAVPAAVR